MNSLPPNVFGCVTEATIVSFVCCGAFLFARGAAKAHVAVVLGVGLLLGTGAMIVEFRIAAVRAQAAALLAYQIPVRELPPGWGKDLSPERREQSIFLARAAFSEHGRLIQYMRGDGSLVTFAPNEEEIRLRDGMIAAKAEFNAVNERMPIYPFRWLAMLVTAMALGFILGRSGWSRPERPEAAVA